MTKTSSDAKSEAASTLTVSKKPTRTLKTEKSEDKAPENQANPVVQKQEQQESSNVEFQDREDKKRSGRRNGQKGRRNKQNDSDVNSIAPDVNAEDLITDLDLKHLDELRVMTNDQLFDIAEKANVKDAANLRRHELMFQIVKRLPASVRAEVRGDGVLEILSDGFGFLRSFKNNYYAGPEDIYVSPSQIRRMGLRTGDTLSGTIRFPNPGERYFALVKLEEVNGGDPDRARARPNFDKLTPLYPKEKFSLEAGYSGNAKDMTGRVIDIVSPIGKGQRAMLVAPPKAGKTMMLKSIAHSIEEHHPDVTLIVLLIDERPEEVTDMMRSVKGEVVSSTFDEPAARHVQVSEMVIEKAKRLVEQGKDVVILLDSLTRLARAYNTVVPSSGKVLTGGVDAHALQCPKRFFGAARNVEEGGSLTIIATALIDTGSRMDEVIFEEFKGTGNSELWLDRKLVEKRTYPAIDISKSSTRHEELLFDAPTLQKIWVLRRILQPMTAVESMEFLLEKLRKCKTNEDFFRSMNQ